MMAAFHPNLVSPSNNDHQSSYPRDHKLASYDELPSQRSSIAIYMDQASAAGSYSEFLSGNSSSSHKCDEFLPDGDRNEMMFIPPTSDPMNLHAIDEQFNSEPANPVGNSGSLEVSGTQLNILGSEQNFQCQGLSLSLGTEMQSVGSLPSLQYQNSNLILPSLLTPNHWTLPSEGDESNQSKGFKNPNLIKAELANSSQFFNGGKDFHADMYMYESSGYSNILNARYLKAARELLDELVSIKKALKPPQSGKSVDHVKETDGGASDISAPPATSGTNFSEVSPAERQELQNKKTKLMSMFDEVNRRYKQYYHQMQFVETSFDMVAGQGAAKTYTALALQTISRHFRCLRDAISCQIETIRKKLGEEDNGQGPLPRLRLVDQQLRQQRALLQHGVMRHAWRPQRGLPENSVSVLRAWLFEHFLHPYPNDSEKLMLAKQTGLTRNQVANWFINARVRLWKPMVEDIYKEEFGDIEGNSKSSQDDAGKPEGSLDKLHEIVTSADTKTGKPTEITALSSSSDADKVTTDSGFMNFQHNYYYSDKNITQGQHEEDGLLPNSIHYDMSSLSGFGINNQVTLELGLQHHESDAFTLSSGNHIRVNNGIASLGSESVDFHCMDPGKQQDRFGNSHLLHDFVV